LLFFFTYFIEEVFMGSERGVTFIELLVAVAIVAILLMSFGSGYLVNDSNTIRAVEKQGYSNVAIVKKHPVFAFFFGGDRGDAAVYEMTATNPAGKSTDIIASTGWLFKGVTVRTK
jgi:prepilin-type N-terminal cleavage/methylation domain-containing protein